LLNDFFFRKKKHSIFPIDMALSIGMHFNNPDVKAGGTNDVLEPSGSQETDDSGTTTTTLSFARKLVTADPLDIAIKPGLTPMVFAAGPRDELSYHGENKQAILVELVPAPM
jgi:hypothetical protein